MHEFTGEIEMANEENIERLNELLPQLNQQDKLEAIHEIAGVLSKNGGSDTQIEFVDICFEMEGDSSQISVIQALANSLVK